MTARRRAGVVDRRAVIGAIAATCAPAAIAKPLQRFAALDYGLTETLLLLGRTPLALVATQDWSKWVVEPPLPPGVVNLGTSREPNLELLQRLNPEAILSTPYLAGIAHRLERIAPVISLPIYVSEGRPLALAQEAARRIAALLGDPPAAEKLIAQADATFEAARARLRSRPRIPVYLVNFMDARHLRVYGAKSLFQDVLDRIGLNNAWRGQTNYWGFATVGIEALEHEGEARLLYLDPVPPGVLNQLKSNPVWNSLSFVKADRIAGLPPVLMFGALPSAMRFARLMSERLGAGNS